MNDFQAIADRVEIEALRAEFTDASMMHDWDRFASLFSEDGAWRMPHIDVELVSREAIRAGVERLRGMWAYFVRTPDGWRFAERLYEVRYVDNSPLPGEGTK